MTVLTEKSKKYTKRSEGDYNLFRALFQWVVTKVLYGALYHIVYRLEVYGKENIPKDSNYIVVSNHLSTLDPPLVASILPNPVAYMAKQELFEHKYLRIMLDWLGAFAVNRGKVGVSTIKTAKSIANTERWILGLFPQGTREQGNEIHRITKGFVGLAKATNCAILPVGIVGTDKHTKIPFAGKIIVKIGPVIEYSEDTEAMYNQWVVAIQELTGFKYVPEETEMKNIPEEVTK